MNTLEDRVRAALRARAEDFSADPDAWARVRARSLAGRRRHSVLRWRPSGRFLIPTAAAAAVVAIVVGVTVAVNGITGRPAGAPTAGADRGGSPSATPSALPSRLGPGFFLNTEPASSAILTMRLPSTSKPAVAYFWLARTSPAYWLDQVVPQIQFCDVTRNVPSGGGQGGCLALPSLGAGQLAIVTGKEGSGVGDGQQIVVGAAAGQVKSVVAVLPDGRVYPAAIGTARGLRYQAWAVGYPPVNGVRLVFRDAAGREIADLSPVAPAGPRQIPQPRSGGVPVFRYYSYGDPPGTMLGYLIDGRVGFWSQVWGGEISPLPANGEPVLGGLLNRFDLVYPSAFNAVEAFGYAHADVAHVVLRLPDGSKVTTSTFAAAWAGSDLRLWAISLPSSTWAPGRGSPTVTATAKDSVGHVLGQVQLGSMG